MTTITLPRSVVEQALGFTMRDFATVRDFEAERARLQDALRAALVQAEPVQEPEFWGRVAARQASRITQLEATGQQALEALEKYQRRMLVEAGCQSEEGEAAIDNLRAKLAEPKAPASDDPHRDHWVAIAETSQRIAASKECGPAEAASFCAAIERLSAALEKSDERASPAQELYTDDVTRIMREAGMTFHLGLPHKAVVEQMTRVVDLVYAETSIKAAQQFAAAPPKLVPLPLKTVERLIYENTKINPNVADDRELLGYIVNAVRAVERAHGIGGQDERVR